MKIGGKDWFAGEDHEVAAVARQFDAEAEENGEADWLVGALLTDGDWDRRNRAAG